VFPNELTPKNVKVSPAVISVRGRRDEKQAGSGSGVFYDQAGWILTNPHVVDGADDIKVDLKGSRIRLESLTADVNGGTMEGAGEASIAGGGLADVKLELDVRDPESSEQFVAAVVRELGGIDILFNNAGLALGRYPFTESNVEDEATVLHTNVDGVLRITRLTLPHLHDGGHILFMGSVAGRQAYQNAASYVAAKFGLRGFVYALREDLLGRPIRITTVDAGLVAGTEFSLVRFKGDAQKAAEGCGVAASAAIRASIVTSRLIVGLLS